MLNDDEGPKDWEIEDEEPPESLRRKWEQDEAPGKRPVICSSCKKETPPENLACIFCGAHLDFKNAGDPCRPFRGFLAWVKGLFRKG